MFTGIIDNIGKVKNLIRKDKNIEIIISPQDKNYLNDIKKGDSIAVNGVCLTVINLIGNDFKSFVSYETVNKTNIKKFHPAQFVNLEKALKLNDRLNGHIVLGHIDGIGKISTIRKIQEDYELKIIIPDELKKLVVLKGSIAVNGISLTIAKIEGNILSIAIIPETYNNTNLKYLKHGDEVNLETDIIGKYVLSSK